jgi:hypothetical protein
MAVVDANPTNDYGDSANLSTAQTGNGASTNVADRGGAIGPALVRITTTIGGGPTCTYALEGSADNTNWYPVLYADSATPATVVATTFAITTATTALKIIQPNQPVRYIRVTYSANTNVTNTTDVFTFRA